MFQNINNDVDFFIYLYKHTILQNSLTEYLNKKITYEDYYNYNTDYMNLIKLHNTLIYI